MGNINKLLHSLTKFQARLQFYKPKFLSSRFLATQSPFCSPDSMIPRGPSSGADCPPSSRDPNPFAKESASLAGDE